MSDSESEQQLILLHNTVIDRGGVVLGIQFYKHFSIYPMSKFAFKTLQLHRFQQPKHIKENKTEDKVAIQYHSHISRKMHSVLSFFLTKELLMQYNICSNSFMQKDCKIKIAKEQVRYEDPKEN